MHFLHPSSKPFADDVEVCEALNFMLYSKLHVKQRQPTAGSSFIKTRGEMRFE